MPEKILAKINKCQAKIGIVGLGYVGLPLVLEFNKANFNVLGLDIDKKKIKALKESKT